MCESHGTDLFAGHAEVDDTPPNDAWSELAETLQIERTDAWVQLAADEKVIHHVPGVPSFLIHMHEGRVRLR